jgi:hypothetical protein
MLFDGTLRQNSPLMLFQRIFAMMSLKVPRQMRLTFLDVLSQNGKRTSTKVEHWVMMTVMRDDSSLFIPRPFFYFFLPSRFSCPHTAVHFVELSST